MAGFEHTQGSANTTWTITHNLGISNPIIDFWTDDATPEKILPSSVIATNSNTITATFSSSRAGTAVAVIEDTTGYNHVQAAANTTWTISHNLGAAMVALDCIVLEGGSLEKILPLTVLETDTNTITVTFSTAREGFARVADIA